MEKWIRARFLPGIPLGEDGRRVTAGKDHIALSRRAAREGMVLLKNEGNALPLPPGCKIALFGKATIDYVKGGGGSGDVTVPYVRNIYDGFVEILGRKPSFPAPWNTIGIMSPRGMLSTGCREWSPSRRSRMICSGRPGLLRIQPSSPSAVSPEKAGTGNPPVQRLRERIR